MRRGCLSRREPCLTGMVPAGWSGVFESPPARDGQEGSDSAIAGRRHHNPEKVVRKLAQADRMLGEGEDVADVCWQLHISEQTYYRWRNQFGGLKAEDAKRV